MRMDWKPIHFATETRIAEVFRSVFSQAFHPKASCAATHKSHGELGKSVAICKISSGFLAASSSRPVDSIAAL